MRLYRAAVTVFSLVFMGLGIALLAVTAAHGGGVTGFVLGALFLCLGAGRLTMLRRGRS